MENEKTRLLRVFENNGYSKIQGLRAFLNVSKRPKPRKEPSDLVGSVQLPFIQGTTNKIARILRKHNISLTFRPFNTIGRSLRSVKDVLNPKNMKGVCLISCSYGTPYIGETGHSINQRIHEHVVDIRHCKAWSSALAKHMGKTKHHICLEESKAIVRIDHFHHRKFREATEIEKKVSYTW